MTGGRLLIAGGPDRDPVGLAAELIRSGRSCAPLAFHRVLSAELLVLPDCVIIALFDLPGPDPLPGLLAALDGLPVHAIFLADAGFLAPDDGIRVLRGLAADGLATVLDMLDERDALARQGAGHLAWKQAFFNGFPGIMAVCDVRRRVLFGNAALSRRAGADPAGLACYAALHGRGEPCPWCPADEVLAGRTVSMEIQSPLDGRYFSMTSAPLLLPGEGPLMLSLFADVTDRNMALSRLKALNRDLERRVAERTEVLTRQTAELAEANTRLLELDALKSGFLATVTHDLRTPLTSVMGFAKLTRREFCKEFMPFSEISDPLRRKGSRIADNLRIIENEGLRLTRLVNDFLDLSKIESGRLDWNDRHVDPAEVVRMAIEAVGGEYEQNERLALVVDIAGPLPPLHLDPDRLVQVLVNLLTNAARHTFEGEVTLVARALPRGRVELRVDDTGPGIEAGERERIFDKFYQAHQGDTQPGQRQGTGLGLAICKHIVERYGGAIRAEARAPHGTSFVVELPTASGRSQGGGPAPASARTTSESLLS
ncbi:sensor histidine kinase [Desulfovibrio sp. TomC]|uniref:sensor histidine kinase n=1 Tax=Desulfovibrio sp. TomC TaxID=1562888 RepID=UPI0005739324|nr:HAMP domain-containing sensor histidine kinase [Desulfovibrio sp. TomC]KHK00855.1 Osmosensitive K+ channel histidine kinase KdpD [Desulfovibrio sp. TomC]